MSFTNSALVDRSHLVKDKFNPRKGKISKITIHHNAGVASADNIANFLYNTTRNTSANYIIGQGKLIQSVEEKNRAWTSSNSENDHQAVTIEVANSTTGPKWEILDEDLKLLIELCADICKRNKIEKLFYDGTKEGSLTLHEMFAKTACPGPYIKSKIDYICKEVNKMIAKPKKTEPEKSKTPTAKPPVTTTTTKTLGQIAKEVIRGDWGNGTDRVNRLIKAGYIPANVQKAVNAIIAKKPIPNLPLNSDPVKPSKSNKKTNEQIAREVIRGKWGNGTDRVNRLTKAGYNASKVQKIVNSLLK